MKETVFVLGVIFVMTSAFANTSTNIKQDNQDSKSKIQLGKYERIVKDESMANRASKKATVNAALIGTTFNALSSSIEVGYHIDENSIVTLQYTSMRGDAGYGDDGKGNSISLGLKKFVSNSFYLKPELYRRNQIVIDSMGWSFDNFEFANGGEVEDFGASFKIGNQWQWNTFTIGCDWFGLSRTLSVIEDDTNDNGFPETTVSFLNFYLGMTF